MAEGLMDAVRVEICGWVADQPDLGIPVWVDVSPHDRSVLHCDGDCAEHTYRVDKGATVYVRMPGSEGLMMLLSESYLIAIAMGDCEEVEGLVRTEIERVWTEVRFAQIVAEPEADLTDDVLGDTM